MQQEGLFGSPRSGYTPYTSAAHDSEGRLSWRYAGVDFAQPRMDVNIKKMIVAPYCYVQRDDGSFKVEQSINLFECNAARGSKFSNGGVNWRVIPATEANLIRFLSLPLIPQEQRTIAMDLLLQWHHAIPSVCTLGILLKNGAVPIEGTDRRLPALSKTVEEVRPLTAEEQSMMVWGYEFPESTRRVKKTIHEVYDESAQLARHTIGTGYAPFSQQLIGAWAIVQTKRMGLWYDMRVGKTLTAIIAAKELLRLGKIDTILVICPVTNMYDPWAPELEKMGLRTAVLDGSKKEDEDHIYNASLRDKLSPQVLITNYERLGSRYAYLTEHLDMSRVMVIADETSAIKNPTSNRSRYMHTLGEDVEYVVMLNGTPMEQGPQDLWSQYLVLDPWGCVFDVEFYDFCETWLEQYAPGKWCVQGGLESDFQILLSTYGIRYIRAEADQFSGKDKSFRYVKLKPTKEVFDATVQVHRGFLEMIADGKVEREEMTQCVLRTYGFMREIACGYSKFRPDDCSSYKRVRHRQDAKLIWIRTFIESNPAQPLVIYCEFNEIEQRLKEMLTDMGVTFGSTRPMFDRVNDTRILPRVPIDLWNRIGEILKEIDEAAYGVWSCVYATHDVIMPEQLRYHDALLTRLSQDLDQGTHDDHPGVIRLKDKIQKVRALMLRPGTEEEGDTARLTYERLCLSLRELLASLPGECKWTEYLEPYVRYIEKGTFSAEERAKQVEEFNQGDRHVFILKAAQGRGMSLSRKPAVLKGIGTWPSIIYTAPTWSLGSWDQSSDRCVTTDPATGRSVHTLVWALVIAGSLEEYILESLRQKKSVQATLLQDHTREGFTSFLDDMMENMRSKMTNAEGYFDVEEMEARIVLGVPPYSKLTETLIRNKGAERHRDTLKANGFKVNGKQFVDWVNTLPYDDEISQAFRVLMTRIKD